MCHLFDLAMIATQFKVLWTNNSTGGHLSIKVGLSSSPPSVSYPDRWCELTKKSYRTIWIYDIPIIMQFGYKSNFNKFAQAL